MSVFKLRKQNTRMSSLMTHFGNMKRLTRENIKCDSFAVIRTGNSVRTLEVTFNKIPITF